MDPITIGLAVQGAGGIVNYFANKSAQEKAAILQDQNFREWMALQIPNPEDQKIAYQQLTSVGTLSPALEQQIDQAPSALNKVAADPATQAAQMNALNALQQEGFHGGMNLQDKATLQAAQQENQAQARGNSGAIMQNLAQRGASNSGFGVAAQLDNAQNTANQNASSGLNAAAAAQQRALEAIAGAGSLAGTMQQNKLSQDNTVAKANDAINNFNTRNVQDVQQRNVNSLNAAQAANLGNAQRISDANVGMNNDATKYNAGLAQQAFNNKVIQMKGAQGVTDNQSELALKGGQTTGNFATNTANMIGGALTNKANQDWWSNYMKSQQQPQPSAGSNLNPDNAAAVGRIKKDVDDDEWSY